MKQIRSAASNESLAASIAVTISSPGRPYMVYRIPPSTDGDEYPSPSRRCQITLGPAAGQLDFSPLLSVVKFLCGPPHCVQGTNGADLHPDLETETIAHYFRKASSPDKDDYSEFEGKDAQGRTCASVGIDAIPAAVVEYERAVGE